MEDAFTKLKQVTAVSSLEEMHEKFSNQKNNKKALEHDVKEAEARLLSVKASHQRQEELFQDLKSSGGGIAEFSRETIIRLEASVELARNTHRTARAASDRLSNVLLGLNQGSRGLLQRVQPYIDLADGGVFELTQTDEDLPWADTLDALSSAEQVFAKMLDTLNGEGSALGAMQVPYEEDEDNSNKSDDAFVKLEDTPALANNIRVKSTKIVRDELMGRNAVEDEVLAAEEALANKAPIAPYLPNNVLPNNTSFSMHDIDTMALNRDETQITNASTLTSAVMINDATMISEGFPTRAVVKKGSLLTTLEAQRQAEIDLRRKRLQDRVSGKGAADDVGAGIASIAKVKAQKAMASRLSTVKSLKTLPEGVTVSDDIMTKTEAFLHQLPDLL